MPTHTLAPLRDCLSYEPKELQFGTSGRRGEVVHLTQLEVFINAVAELEFLQSLSTKEGGIVRGDPFYYARDLRPSSSAFVPEQQGRGELAQVIELAIRYAGMIPVNEGMIPTPALTYYAVTQGKGSMMVTGSHIPFDRNGYKTNTSAGELLKRHEQPINEKVKEVRNRLYNQPFEESLFGGDGQLKEGSKPFASEQQAAASLYINRYIDFFGEGALSGLKLLVYQHSAVGRDLLAALLTRLGAEIVTVGRSNIFVPIDTENMDAEQLAAIQALYDDASKDHGPFDAIVSTDGDSDRPLILGINPSTSTVKFLSGDLVGMLTAEFLAADAVVVPISCNDSIDRGALSSITEPKTRIGSPFVIAGMEKCLSAGKKSVCGWEANGGFLTGSDIYRNGKCLKALPTRDAILPILTLLTMTRTESLPLVDIFSRLPKRYSCAALIKQFPRVTGLKIVKQFSPQNDAVKTVLFKNDATPVFKDASDLVITADPIQAKQMQPIKQQLETVFGEASGFGQINQMNFVDGVRMYFNNGDVAHLRPSGNADELRIYAVADSQARADQIAATAVAEPDGLLRKLARIAG